MEVVDGEDSYVGHAVVDREQRGRPGYLVGDRQERLTRRRLRSGDERDALGAEVERRGARRFARGEVAVVDVGDEGGCRGVGDVVDDHAAHPLETHERVGAPVDLADRDALGLGALRRAAGVEARLVVAGVEVVRDGVGQNPLEAVARVEDLLTVRGPDRERPTAVAVELAVAVGAGRDTEVGGDLQASEVGIALERGERAVGAHGGESLLAQVLHACLVDVRAPLAGVALVGGDEVGSTVRLVGVHAVGHVDALQARIRLDADRAVAVAGIQPVADGAVILEAEGVEVGDSRGREVDDRYRVRLLDRNVSGGPVDGDVLRLEVAADAIVRERAVTLVGRGDVGAEDPHPGRQVRTLVSAESCDADIRLRRRGLSGRQGHDPDGPLGVGREVGRGLALVRDDREAAVLGDGHHVGKGADDDAAEDRGCPGIRVEEDERARIGLHRALQRDDAEPVGTDGDGVGDAVRRDGEELRRSGRIGVVEHAHGAGLGIDDEQTIAVRRDDLGGGRAEDAGRVGADRGQRERRIVGGVHDRNGGRVRRERGRRGHERCQGERAYECGRGGRAEHAASSRRRHGCPQIGGAGMDPDYPRRVATV